MSDFNAHLPPEAEALLGKWMLRVGSYLIGDLEKQNEQKVRLTTDVALRPLHRIGLK
jgi:hypothetical protein